MTSIPANRIEQTPTCNPCTALRDVSVIVIVALAALASLVSTTLLLANLGVPLGSLNAIAQSFGIKPSLASFIVSAGTLGVSMLMVCSIMKEIQRKRHAREQLPDNVKYHIQEHAVEESVMPGHYVTHKLDDQPEDQNYYLVFRNLSGPVQKLNFKAEQDQKSYIKNNLKGFKSESECAKTYPLAEVRNKVGGIALVGAQQAFKSLQPGSVGLQKLKFRGSDTEELDMVCFHDGKKLHYHYCRKDQGAKYIQDILRRHWRNIPGYEKYLPDEKECLYNASIESGLKERLRALETLPLSPTEGQMLTAQLAFKVNQKTRYCVILSLPERVPMRLYFSTEEKKNAYIKRHFPQFTDALLDSSIIYGIPGLVEAPLQDVDIKHLLIKKGDYYSIEKTIDGENWFYVVYNDGKKIENCKAQTLAACLLKIGKRTNNLTDWINSLDHKACNDIVTDLLQSADRWDYTEPLRVKTVDNLDIIFFHDGKELCYVMLEKGEKSELFKCVQSTFYSLLPGEYAIVPHNTFHLAVLNVGGQLKYKKFQAEKNATDWIKETHPNLKDQKQRNDLCTYLSASAIDHLKKSTDSRQYCLVVGSGNQLAIYSKKADEILVHYAPQLPEGKISITLDQIKDMEISEIESTMIKDYLGKISQPVVTKNHYLEYPIYGLCTVLYWNSKGTTHHLITRPGSAALSQKVAELQSKNYTQQQAGS